MARQSRVRSEDCKARESGHVPPAARHDLPVVPCDREKTSEDESVRARIRCVVVPPPGSAGEKHPMKNHGHEERRERCGNPSDSEAGKHENEQWRPDEVKLFLL